MKEDMDNILEDERQRAWAQYVALGSIAFGKECEASRELQMLRRQAFNVGWNKALDLMAAAIQSKAGAQVIKAMEMQQH